MRDWQTIALDAPLLLEASAGTGKTFAIEHLVLRLVVERQLPLSQILVLTYTRTAAAELASRIELRLRRALALCEGATPDVQTDAVVLDLMRVWATLPGGSGGRLSQTLRTALESVPEAWIGTIHGLCQRLLGRYEEFVALQQPAEPSGRDLRLDGIVRRWMYDVMSAEIPVAARDVLDPACFDMGFWQELARQLPKFGREWEALRVWVREAPLVSDSLDLPGARQRLDAVLEGLRTYAASRSELARMWPEHWPAYRDALAEAYSRGDLSGTKTRLAKGMRPWEELESCSRAPEGAFGAIAPNRDCLTETWLSTAFKKGKDNRLWLANPLRRAWDQAQRELADLKASADAALIGYFLTYFRQNYQMQAGQIQTFDDIVETLRAALLGAEAEKLCARLRRDFPAMIVDEFQDTDPAQWDIFRQLYFGDDPGVFIGVGDPKQAIYGFRGADLFSYMAAYQAVPAERRLPLTQNFRSDARYVHALNEVYGAPARFSPWPIADTSSLPLQHAKPDRLLGPQRALSIRIGEAIGSASSVSLAQASADEILNFLQGDASLQTLGGLTRPVQAADIAVLVRSKRQGELLGQALAERGIASSARTAQSVLHEPEVQVLHAWLHALAAPRSLRRLRAVLVVKPWSLPVPLLMQQAELLESEALTAFVQAAEVFARAGLTAAVRWLLRDSALAVHVAPQNSRFWANLWHVCELADMARYGQSMDAAQLAQWLNAQALATYTEVSDTATRLRLDGNASAVAIMTMHAAKGLQFPVVFVPSARGRARAGNVHAVRAMDTGGPSRTIYIFKSEARKVALQTSELDADVRLLYVALTRAEHYTWIGYSVPKQKALPHAIEWLLAQSTAQPSCDEILQHLAERWPPINSALDCGRWLPQSRPPMDVQLARSTGRSDLGLPQWPDLARIAGLRYSLTTSFSGIHRLATGATLWESEGTPVQPSLWDCLPGGAASGIVVHQIFELVARDPGLLDNAPRKSEVIRRAMLDHGLMLEGDALERAVDALLLCGPVAGRSNLRDLLVAPDVVRRPEMRFVRAVPTVTDEQLRQIQLRLRSEDPSYVFEQQALHTLQTVGVREGLWQGAMDLVYQSEGRFGLLDYKTNTLAEYGPLSLHQSVADNDYGLQMWIYWITLLSTVMQLRPTRQLNEAWYTEYMGTIQYLYVRGMVPGATTGLLSYRPSWELTEALWQCFGGVDQSEDRAA